MPPVLGPERAEILGLQALAWLAGEETGLVRFLNASGISGADLKAAAGTPGLNLAVLDFLLANEDLLLAFCESGGIGPTVLHQARSALDGEAS